MDLTDNTKTLKIIPFPVENNKPQLSINIDEEIIGAFYMEYYSTVCKRCLVMLGNREDAEDAAHDVFTKIHILNSKKRLDIPYPKTYFTVTAKNMSINAKKKARRELNKIYDMATSGSLIWFSNRGEHEQTIWEAGIIDNGYEQMEAEIIVKAILDEQDETTRKIYFYKYHDDMTLEQIGEVVGLGKSAVHKKIKQLEKQVKIKLGKTAK